ncbi:probable RNA polymerase II nuclear localization protein SLC7A6OS [Diachasma alloeum]|uniref:probable RNA polymerase II nuclear localization protein SLC7A6OS n=1 Tax=Diachasma alloeum TaxID=454923 RepID=UPI000738155A|nr:probable RNA polymerase II nuclear localization protein SLC7A6OS [Diachasma alloeum]
MSTVLRIKRRIDDEPCDVLLIACKKRKVEESEAVRPDESGAVTAVVKFAGTVQTQEEDLTHHLTKTLSKEELKANYKQHIVDITSKSRVKTQEKSKEGRYRVVNCYRSLGGPTIEEVDDSGMTVIDVEDSVSCYDKMSSNQKEAKFVYDLYYTQTEEKLEPDNDISIHPLDQELVFDNYRDPANNSDAGESEDSNSESNWRNEYPDSEHSDNSIDEDDMRAAVAKLKVDGDESDLSTDDDFVYAVDENDVDNYGYKYAKYKAKIKVEISGDDSDLSDYSGVCITEEPDDDEEYNNY